MYQIIDSFGKRYPTDDAREAWKSFYWMARKGEVASLRINNNGFEIQLATAGSQGVRLRTNSGEYVIAREW